MDIEIVVEGGGIHLLSCIYFHAFTFIYWEVLSSSLCEVLSRPPVMHFESLQDNSITA